MKWMGIGLRVVTSGRIEVFQHRFEAKPQRSETNAAPIDPMRLIAQGCLG
jgi:hypothetical protein